MIASPPLRLKASRALPRAIKQQNAQQPITVVAIIAAAAVATDTAAVATDTAVVATDTAVVATDTAAQSAYPNSKRCS